MIIKTITVPYKTNYCLFDKVIKSFDGFSILNEF